MALENNGPLSSDDHGVLLFYFLALIGREEIAKLFQGEVCSFGFKSGSVQLQDSELLLAKDKFKTALKHLFLFPKILEASGYPLTVLSQQGVTKKFSESVSFIGGILIALINEIGVLVVYQIVEQLFFAMLEKRADEGVVKIRVDCSLGDRRKTDQFRESSPFAKTHQKPFKLIVELVRSEKRIVVMHFNQFFKKTIAEVSGIFFKV